jgi:hypothetical protein
LVIIGITATGCSLLDNQYKQDILGSYKFVLTENVDQNIITIDGVSQYNSDLSVKTSATLTITFTDENLGSVSIKYSLVLTGTYDIKDSYLIEHYPENSIIFSYLPSNKNIDNLFSNELNTIMNDQVIPYMKNQLSNTSLEILEINDNQMILSDGKTNFNYNRTNELPQINIQQKTSESPKKNNSLFNEEYLKTQFEATYKNNDNEVYNYESCLVGDLNNDGIEEGIVKFSQSPISGNTYSQQIVLFYFENNNLYYLPVELNGFSAIKGIGSFELKKVKNGKLYVDLYTFADEDPYCCPSIVDNAIYELTENVFDRIN